MLALYRDTVMLLIGQCFRCSVLVWLVVLALDAVVVLLNFIFLELERL